jgi:glutamyl-tRNA reductase
MEIVVLGLNHRTAPVELRERVAFTPAQAREAVQRLRSQEILEESVILSTCNRSEVYGVLPDASANAMERVEAFFAGFHGLTQAELSGALYFHTNHQAVRHLYRVASGLDSMLLGEAEVLGQVRAAYRGALDHGATGRFLNRLFQRALEVGKRVRSETSLGLHPVSVAFAGVKLAEQILGQLSDKRALILGAGATSERVIGHLRDRGIQNIRLLNRTPRHAEELAARFGGEVVPWDGFSEAFEWPDLIVTSVSATEPILTRELLEKSKGARGNRPLLVIDLGLPRNVAPSAGNLAGVYVYNIDDLTLIVEQNKKAREQEVPRAEAIIEEHVEKFIHWHASATSGLVSGPLKVLVS